MIAVRWIVTITFLRDRIDKSVYPRVWDYTDCIKVPQQCVSTSFSSGVHGQSTRELTSDPLDLLMSKEDRARRRSSYIVKFEAKSGQEISFLFRRMDKLSSTAFKRAQN